MRPHTLAFGVPFDFVDSSEGSALDRLMQQQQQQAAQQQQAVQQQPPPQAPVPQAPVGGITVVYETGWANAYLHHNAGEHLGLGLGWEWAGRRAAV